MYESTNMKNSSLGDVVSLAVVTTVAEKSNTNIFQCILKQSIKVCISLYALHVVTCLLQNSFVSYTQHLPSERNE